MVLIFVVVGAAAYTTTISADAAAAAAPLPTRLLRGLLLHMLLPMLPLLVVCLCVA